MAFYLLIFQHIRLTNKEELIKLGTTNLLKDTNLINTRYTGIRPLRVPTQGLLCLQSRGLSLQSFPIIIIDIDQEYDNAGFPNMLTV